jgi:hypothetical protein
MDPAAYNLIDPPYQNTVTVPKAGWAAIRFRATNPGELFLAFGKYYLHSEMLVFSEMQSASKYNIALFFKRVNYMEMFSNFVVTLFDRCVVHALPL